jgi:hypothetical protein
MPDPNPNTDSTQQFALSEIDINDIVERPGLTEPVTVDFNGSVIEPQEVNDDIIAGAIRDDDLPDAILKAIMTGMADEQYALLKLRLQKEKEGKDVTRMCTSRGALLKYMSETLLQRQALVGGSGELDLKSPKFRAIIKMFLDIVKDTFDEVKIPIEYRDLFFHALGHNLEGWEHKAEKIVKSIH